MAQTKRIDYIDALRGLTMILVVFSHIYIPNDTPLNMFLINLRMPMFFFISGFLSFRMVQSWSAKETISRLGSKVRTMIIPAVTIGLIYTVIYRGELYLNFFTHLTHKGYWFTLAMFNMLFIYYIARWIHERRGKTTAVQFTRRLHILSLILLAACSDMAILGNIDRVLTLSFTFRYFHFFVFGLVCSCNREWFEGVFDKSKRMGVMVVMLFLLSWVVIWGKSNPELVQSYIGAQWFYILKTLLIVIIGYCGIFTIFGFFRHYGDFFSENRFIGKPLQFVGRNTLDIYLLHYFVLLGMPTFLYPYIAGTNNLLIPLVVGFSVAAIIVAISLLISRVLRLSDHVAYYLLGARDVTLNTNKTNIK
jgi:fucose 4-O-acetylase-like acetyltransferase